jgi:2-polyprenyl-3-methyl-5-hydroxy-6-metoxy-1,4-benzoquinol methylase
MSGRRQLAALYRSANLPSWYTALKLWILPLEEFSRHLPSRGRILDVGCGYGYLANYLSLMSAERHVIGNDVDPGRIRVAQATRGDRAAVEFLAADARALSGDFDGVALADMLHHVPYEEQEPLLKDLYAKLRPGGVLVMRETDRRLRLRYLVFNYCLEWWLYRRQEKLRFRKASEWARLLSGVGFVVRQAIPNKPWAPYLTVTFVCVKP